MTELRVVVEPIISDKSNKEGIFLGYMPYSVKDLLACWRGSFKGNQRYHMWNAIPLCLIWSFWKESNARSFDGIQASLLHLKLCFLRSLFNRLRSMGDCCCSSFLGFLNLCDFRS